MTGRQISPASLALVAHMTPAQVEDAAVSCVEGLLDDGRTVEEVEEFLDYSAELAEALRAAPARVAS